HNEGHQPNGKFVVQAKLDGLLHSVYNTPLSVRYRAGEKWATYLHNSYTFKPGNAPVFSGMFYKYRREWQYLMHRLRKNIG
ncbi:hypothetical protein, partial [Bifidobacterium longum]|uniref:hypothetical protein n=1 Tax=Bifidobacterium longum TaxID=216816 RepID=UPI001EDD75DE